MNASHPMRRYQWLVKYAARRWRSLVSIIALTLITPLISALSPWPMKLLVDGALNGNAIPEWVSQSMHAAGVSTTPIAYITLAAILSLVFFLLASALDAALSLTWTAAGQGMVYDLAADLFARLQRLSLLFHNRRETGDSLARIGGDAWCVYGITENLLVAPMQHSLTLVTLGIVAYQLDPYLTGVSLLIAPAMAGTVLFFGPRLKRWSEQQRTSESRLTSFVHQTIAAMPLVQTFATRDRNVANYQRIAAGAVRINLAGSVLKNSYTLLSGFVAAVGVAIVMVVGARRVQIGALSVGGLLVFIAYLRTLHGAAQGLMQIHGSMKSIDARVDRVAELLHSQESVPESPGARVLNMVRPFSVVLDDVFFGYEADRSVLEGINLELNAGEVTALVGPTGAGKSTLASLIPRLFDPWSGRVLLGGEDVKELKLGSVRGQVSVVPQEAFLLPLSIRENIAYGDPSAGMDRIRAAAEAAGAVEFIEALPLGYETVLGERGSTLSAGQRQRLSIARALLKDAPILLLDEPTSALDAQTEAGVVEAVHRLMAGRTCLVIAHRLSTVRRADQIVVLEHGRIVQRGRHETLMQEAGLYRTMCELQFGTQLVRA